MSVFSEATFAMGSVDRIHLTGEVDDYLEAPVVSLMLEQGDETQAVLLDEYHLRELRKALQRAERWIKDQEMPS